MDQARRVSLICCEVLRPKFLCGPSGPGELPRPTCEPQNSPCSSGRSQMVKNLLSRSLLLSSLLGPFPKVHTLVLALDVQWWEEVRRDKEESLLKGKSMFHFFLKFGTCQPTPVFLPGKVHGQRSLAGCSQWGYMIEHACMRVEGDGLIAINW